MSRVKLGDVTIRIKEYVDKDNTDLIYYIGGEHFEPKSLTVDNCGIIQGSTIGPAFHHKFRKGDVLLMSRNPHLRKAGIVNFEGICSDVSYVIRTRDEKVLLQRFIPLLFQSDAFWDFAEMNKKGSTNFFLNWSDFEKFEFELPDLDDQKRLTDTLWSINDTLVSYKEMINDSDELVKSQFIEMFDSFEKDDLSSFADITMGQSPDSKSYNDDQNGMPFFQGKGDYGDKVAIVSHWTTEPSKVVEANVILMSVRAPVGPVNISPVKCCIGRGLCGINAINGKTNNEFLYNALNVMQDEISSNGVGSTFDAITKKDVYSIKIPNAPIALMDDYSRFAQQIDKSKFEINKSMEELIRLFQKIIRENIY